MTASRKKLITGSVLLVGIGVLVVAGITLQRPLQERYWLWKLETGATEEERLTAAERLEELGSVKAVPLLIDACAGALSQTYIHWWIDPDTSRLSTCVELSPSRTVRTPHPWHC